MQTYVIGGTRLILHTNGVMLKEDPFISRFQVDSGEETPEPPIVYTLEAGKLEQYARFPEVFHDGSFELHDTPEGMVWICHWATSRFAYGFFLPELLETENLHCCCEHGILNDYPLSVTRFLSSTGLHSKLLRRGGIVLHGAYIQRDGEAVILAGSSGIGKSTQAGLWEKTGRGKTLNGDRVLLRCVAGRWYAYGYPCCGSSSICENWTLPLKAVVLLEQGNENRISPVGQGTKLRRLLLGTQVLSWQRQETERVFELVSRLLEQVPVLCLSARPDNQAVQVLDEALGKL